MKLLLSDNQMHLRFAPLTLTRPIAELRTGFFTNTERWKQLLMEVEIGFETESYLAKKFPAISGIWINALCIPTPALAKAIQALKSGQALYYKDTLIAYLHDQIERIDFMDSALIILKNRWDLYLKNEAIIKQNNQAKNNSINLKFICND